MKATKILSKHIGELKISSLPIRPTSPTAMGGAGMTSTQLREAFDKLPLLIIQHYNELIDDIEGGQIVYDIRTEIEPGHTLGDMLGDVCNGNFASYLDVGGRSLMTALLEINERLSGIEEKLK